MVYVVRCGKQAQAAVPGETKAEIPGERMTQEIGEIILFPVGWFLLGGGFSHDLLLQQHKSVSRWRKQLRFVGIRPVAFTEAVYGPVNPPGSLSAVIHTAGEDCGVVKKKKIRPIEAGTGLMAVPVFLCNEAKLSKGQPVPIQLRFQKLLPGMGFSEERRSFTHRHPQR